MFRTKTVEKIRTHILCSIVVFFRKSCRLWDNVNKYILLDIHNMAHAHCTLDTWDYRHTLRICNSYCFSAKAMIARTRLNFHLIRLLHISFISQMAGYRQWLLCPKGYLEKHFRSQILFIFFSPNFSFIS